MRQRDDLSFPMHEYARRMQALRQRMAERGLDAVLITTPENICYLTGFESQGHFSFCALIVPLEGEPIMVPRRMEDSGVQARTWVAISCPYEEVEDPIQKVRDTLRLYDLSDNRIGFEKDCWFFTAVQQERLFALSHETSFVDCAGIVEAGRLIKSDLEIEMIRSAARVAEAG
ncbi:putative peptidase [Symmachiella macrocystis]|uniref:Putative peptidase n=2 Tax=Symmachiella macrocystis TaxID=2527985 RepID=A0A5C6BN24_9PLAN|nr:putative peptidase [Symmachiella macrocystis]